MTLCEMALKNEHNLMTRSHTFTGRTPLIAIGSSCVIMTWQSWAFMLLMLNFNSLMVISLLTFEEYPVSTLSSLKKVHIFFFSVLFNVQEATGSFFFPSSRIMGCSSCLTFI